MKGSDGCEGAGAHIICARPKALSGGMAEAGYTTVWPIARRDATTLRGRAGGRRVKGRRRAAAVDEASGGRVTNGADQPWPCSKAREGGMEGGVGTSGATPASIETAPSDLCDDVMMS